MLADLVDARLKLSDIEREMRAHKKAGRFYEANKCDISYRYWFAQHVALVKKCKFLRDTKTISVAEQERAKKENIFEKLLVIDDALVNSKTFKSELVYKAFDYATQVIKGKIPACEELKQACQRHIDDLKRSKDKSYPYKFSVYLADRALRFISNLPHVKGKWAKHRELLHLEAWECFIVASLFGWVDKRTSLRRFREAYLEICRKNGKSVLAAAIALFMFLADGEFGAEVYSGATSEKQAWEVFRPARLMLIHTPKLIEAAGATINAKSLYIEKDGSRFEPVIGKPGDGASPSCAIIDEFHEHDTPDLVDTMQTGMLAREQPLLLKITTAGYNLAGPCYEHRTKARQILSRVLEDERVFAVIYSIDVANDAEEKKGDDWSLPEMLRKANPNLGVSVDLEYLLALQRSAVVNVSEQTRFKTKHLNVWCAARSAWVSLQQWQAASDVQLTEEELVGEECWFIFDLASKLDIAAYVKVFRRYANDMMHLYVFGKYYLPESAIENPSKNQMMYRKWHAKGLLRITDGATTDFETIKDDIVEDAKIYNPIEIVYDPFNATHMSQLLTGEGLQLVEFVQKPQNFAVPMDEVQAALKDGRLHHDGNEVMTWMMANVTVRPAKKGLFWPTKETAEAKIDGPVAMIMGVSRATAVEGDSAATNQFIKEPIVA